MTIEQITVADGKYTVTNDQGTLTALRNGEPWGRDLVGDNLVYSMFVRIRELEEALGTRKAAAVVTIPDLSEAETSSVIELVNATCQYEPHQTGYVRELMAALANAMKDKAEGRAVVAPSAKGMSACDEVVAPPSVKAPDPEWASNWPMSKCLKLAKGWTGGIDVTSSADNVDTGPQWKIVMAMMLNEIERLHCRPAAPAKVPGVGMGAQALAAELAAAVQKDDAGTSGHDISAGSSAPTSPNGCAWSQASTWRAR